MTITKATTKLFPGTAKQQSKRRIVQVLHLQEENQKGSQYVKTFCDLRSRHILGDIAKDGGAFNAFFDNVAKLNKMLSSDPPVIAWLDFMKRGRPTATFINKSVWNPVAMLALMMAIVVVVSGGW